MWKYLTHDIAIDLGTANTLVALRGHGIILREPSVVAINKTNERVLAVGKDARQMLGRTPASVVAMKPLQDGVIWDFDSTEAMIRYLIHKTHSKFPKLLNITKPRIVIGVPSSVTEVEKNAVVDAAKMAGARKVYVVEEAMAAAIGSGLNVEEPKGKMVIDIGGGTTDIAIISLGGIVQDSTIKVAGDEMDQEIINYAKNKYNLLIGLGMAEDLKIEMGEVHSIKSIKYSEIRGRDIVSGLPKTLKISSVELKEALELVLRTILANVKDALENTPPQLLADILETGITITGGGAMIKNIDKYFEEALKTPVVISEKPLESVITGLCILLEEIDLLEKVQIKDTNFI